MEQIGGIFSNTRGYKKPNVACPELDEVLLRRLQRNDPDVVGLTIDEGEFWIEGAGAIIGNNTCLTTLLIVTNNDEWEEDSWLHELCRGLSHNRSIEWFSLDTNECLVELEIFPILVPFLENNQNLRCITLVDFTNPQTLISMVSVLTKCKHLRLQCIEVTCSDTGTADKTVAMFFESLINLQNLTDLAFALPTARMGCKALAKLLTDPASKIMNLLLTFEQIDDECIGIISDALSENSRLKSLEIAGNGLFAIEHRSVSSCGWGIFFGAVSRAVSLQHLSICNTLLLDCDVACLTNTLAINHSVTKMELAWNAIPSRRNVLRKFAKWLRSPNATLTELTLCGCTLSTRDKIAILLSLKVNKFITMINFEWTGEVTADLWKCLRRLLYDKTSIDNTYMSNHTLHTFLVGDWSNGDVIPRNITHLLKMNKPKDKEEVARRKVFDVHFTGEVTANHPLARFPETMIPHVMSWFGRDNLGFSAMFNAVQFFPSMFDCRTAGSVARKRRKCT